ncbi:MAG: hypothetical protein BWY63_00860 [Chloroflexi bacterium ADurb.Bin360]|nr:MAG: hypothetical protein BWY63_00860 [Chloroflexi bacterium ADurb.Bin360]
MVRSVGEFRVLPQLRHENDLFGFRVEQVGGQVAAQFLGVQGHIENGLGFGAVVEDAFAAAPTRIGKEQSHYKPHLAIRGRVRSQLRAIRLAVPGEIAFVAAIALVHVGFGPLPDAIEFLFFVHLDGDHHAVGHALRTHVIVARVEQVSHVGPDRVVDALGKFIAIKQLLESRLVFGLDFGFAFAEVLGEQVAVHTALDGGFSADRHGSRLDCRDRSRNQGRGSPAGR